MSGGRLGRWARPPTEPEPTYFNMKAEEVLEKLGELDDPRSDQVLAEAELAYKDAAERADGAERRATTIQGAIAIATSLSLAGGSLLLDSDKVPDRCWRWVLGVVFGVAILALAVAAWRAFLVTWPRYAWASPTYEEVFDHATERDASAIKLRRAADLFVAYGRNHIIAAVKISLLGSAVRWLIAALVLVAIFGCLLAAAAIDAAPEPSGKAAAHRATGK